MFHDLHDRLDELVVFHSLTYDRVFSAFRRLLGSVGEGMIDWWVVKREYYGFVRALYAAHTDDWTAYMKDLILTAETPCSWYAAQGLPIPPTMVESAKRELRYLSWAASITSFMLKERHVIMGVGEFTGRQGLQPEWKAHEVNFLPLFMERLNDIHRYGVGEFAKHRMFHMERSYDEDDYGYRLKAVTHPDKVQLSDLTGYTRQREQVIANTRALAEGHIASNILLYGDAGTGKSATVKAVANAFADQGVRLIEMTKNELRYLPKLLERLSEDPLKFILFIDDLSFQDNDDDFSALKAVLEGSISARSQNVVIYATSNRRHIVRETFSQRAGDDVHRNDTMHETISLSDRFGLQILFDKPNKALYLEIVHTLAEQYGITMDTAQLEQEAERFALRKSGRSARAARQLVEQLAAAQSVGSTNHKE